MKLTPAQRIRRGPLGQAERQVLIEQLTKYKGNVVRTAHALGLNRNTLAKRIGDHEIPIDKLRNGKQNSLPAGS